MKKIKDLKIKIFADGANINTFYDLNKDSLISGFTTNPSLMKKAGVKDYKNFAKEVLSIVTHKPVSFEIFADELSEIEMQAFEIGSWGKNVNVKIPITNTKKQSTTPIIQKLLHNNIACNVTAIFTIDQIKKVLEVANKKTNLILSIFSGRIADSGIDPVPLCAEAVSLVKNFSNIEILWASTRELLNIFHAEQSGCNIITVPDDLLKKLSLIGKNLEDYSLETVLMFYNDAQKAGYKIF